MPEWRGVGTTDYRRPIYYHVARLNQEVLNVGQALRFLESVDVRYVAGPGNQVPAAATAWQPGAGDDQLIRSLVIEGTSSEPIEWRDILIGFFRDDQGGNYFMLTNLWHGEGIASAERSVAVTLRLRPGVTAIGRLSRETGEPELLAVNGDEFRVTLPGGTGDLLRFGSAEFPGLDQKK